MAAPCDLTKIALQPQTFLTTVHRGSDCVGEFKAVALLMELTVPCTPTSIYEYITIWTHKLWPPLVTPCCTTDPCMLHRPAPQIISRPVNSVNAVGLPSDSTSKFTNSFLTACSTNRRVCVGLNGSDVCLGHSEGLGVRNCSVHERSLLYRQSEMWNCAAIYTRLKISWWFLLSHQVWEFGIAGLLYCSLKCGSLVKRDCFTAV